MKRFIVVVALLCLPMLLHAQPEVWEQSFVEEDFSSALSVRAADLEGDGDNDIFVASYGQGELRVYKAIDLGWEMQVIADSLNTPICIMPGDLDGDNDQDLVVASLLGSTVKWYEYSVLGWTIHTIDNGWTRTRELKVVDLDGDNDLDVVASSEMDGVTWWRNNGNNSWTQQNIDTSGQTPYGMDVGDMDGDGDLDVVGVDYGSNQITWYENTGVGWTAHGIATPGDSPRRVSCGDLDNDEDIDVAVAFDDASKLAWFENQGGATWPQHMIASNYLDPNDIRAVDIDNDSDIDIVACSYSGGMITIWENELGSFNEVMISDEFANSWNVEVADVDGDNDFDILSTSYWGGDIAWWAQPGVGFPVSLDMIPQDYPIVIPPEGGDFLYGFRIRNHTDNLYWHAGYWTHAIYPDGTSTGVLTAVRIWIVPFMDLLVWNISQHVPDYAPPGEYTFVARAGYEGHYAEGNFIFTKQGNLASSRKSDDGWTSSPVDFGQYAADGEGTAITPGDFKLHPAAPNPFNSSTTVRVDLPEAGALTVEVYNIAGQRVATLAEGSYSAGGHEFAFDGSRLASGVYMILAKTSTGNRSVQKVMLLR